MKNTATALVPRHSATAINEALADTRVVLINGPRQAGKSTLARSLTGGHPATLIHSLDIAETRNAALSDPTGFVQHDGLLVIDEVQRAPELLLSIKAVVDADPRPGRFLLTGSSRLLAMRDLPDALPGRIETVTLWPFTQGELDDTPDGFIDAAFAHGPQLRADSTLTRRDYADRLTRGGYPEAVTRERPARRRQFLTSYVNNLIDRDVRELSDIEYSGRARQLLRALAARSGFLLVTTPLANDLGVSQPTVRHYVDLLEQVYLIRRIPAWSSNLTTRAVATPKVVLTDSGLASHLLSQDIDRLSAPDGAFGALLEGFVAMEIVKQRTWSEQVVEIYHFRDRDQREVDLLLENAAGEIIGVEVKSRVTVRRDDFRGLHHLAERLGSRFIAGYVLHPGTQTLPFGPKLRSLPISALWTAAA